MFGVVGRIVQCHVACVRMKDRNEIALGVPVGGIVGDELKVKDGRRQVALECEGADAEDHLQPRQLDRNRNQSGNRTLRDDAAPALRRQAQQTTARQIRLDTAVSTPQSFAVVAEDSLLHHVSVEVFVCTTSRVGLGWFCPVLVMLARSPGPRLLLSVGFLAGAAISPSRTACLRASLRNRRMASVFSRAALSEGFS
jgi:hypothetical protein